MYVWYRELFDKYLLRKANLSYIPQKLESSLDGGVIHPTTLKEDRLWGRQSEEPDDCSQPRTAWRKQANYLGTHSNIMEVYSKVISPNAHVKRNTCELNKMGCVFILKLSYCMDLWPKYWAMAAKSNQAVRVNLPLHWEFTRPKGLRFQPFTKVSLLICKPLNWLKPSLLSTGWWACWLNQSQPRRNQRVALLPNAGWNLTTAGYSITRTSVQAGHVSGSSCSSCNCTLRLFFTC